MKKKLNTIKNLLFSLFLFIITETRHVFTGATVITNGLLLTLRAQFWSAKSEAQNFVFGTKKRRKELSSISSCLAPFTKNSHTHSYTVQAPRSMFWIGAQGASKARAYQGGPGECSLGISLKSRASEITRKPVYSYQSWENVVIFFSDTILLVFRKCTFHKENRPLNTKISSTFVNAPQLLGPCCYCIGG